jgi:hypothetical protein
MWGASPPPDPASAPPEWADIETEEEDSGDFEDEYDEESGEAEETPCGKDSHFPHGRVDAPPKPKESRRLSDFDAPQKTVKLNDVFLVINDYIELKRNAVLSYENKIKTDAAWDIIALLHKASSEGKL